MTLKEMLTSAKAWDEYGDMDVYNDVTDDCTYCWCGSILTDKGLEEFKDILDLEVEFTDAYYGKIIIVKVDKYEDWEDRWNRVCDLFATLAGYVDDDDYHVWVDDGFDDEEVVRSFDADKALTLLIEHIQINDLKEAVKEDERLLPFLDSIGYCTRNLKEA